MGRISDNTKTRFGKRRVYMIFGAIPYGLMFVLLWFCPFSVETSQFVKMIYYLMAYCLFNTTYTIVYVPYNSLTANITDDYDQRSSLTTVRIILANVGLILGASLFGLFAGENTVFSEIFINAGYDRFEAVKNSYLISSVIFIRTVSNGAGRSQDHLLYSSDSDIHNLDNLRFQGQYGKGQI